MAKASGDGGLFKEVFLEIFFAFLFVVHIITAMMKLDFSGVGTGSVNCVNK